MRMITLLLSLLLPLTPISVVHAEEILRLATTTSTDNSGLIKYLFPEFEKQSGYKVHVIAVGTGKALRMGRDGDVDVLLVHAPKAENTFVDEGYGVKRIPVMYNDFVLVGPKNDPAKIAGAATLPTALKKIADSKQAFISRGDDSGTHKKELSLWTAADVKPGGKWYREAGQGMGKVLQIAGEMDAYTITDRGTWLAFQEKSPLTIVFEGDKQLFNPYSIIAINPEKHADLNHKGSAALINWITSKETQKRIGAFKLHGQQLFTPNSTATKTSTMLEKLN
ncbi:MAG: ABC-type tungstate transport system, periplasmic binding protein [uncultured Thiotrichaceae bacterium]|uniref:ABC-type tungstate transport system, periplasmic binding protein n=1 Tax=uncultured Thiotrichaceae bacterium TaxID=298394 RepID=A0A6S6U2Y9_9GAMM|nr:MAG: ABC-type tungstate transport system, periplasmic binding protein [uncultured Thiotrichaceae bacterium]